MAEDIVVIGAGGFGRETLDVIEAINKSSGSTVWHVIGVVDDSPSEIQMNRLKNRGYRYLGTSAGVMKNFRSARFTIGIGSPATRAVIAEIFENAGWIPETLVHPTANIGSKCVVESGSVICGGVQLSTNCHLGRYTHLNPAAVVGHDSVLGDFVSANPGAIISGDVTVGRGTLIGAGAVILQGLSIGDEVTVGASACVTRNTSDYAIVKGIPAR